MNTNKTHAKRPADEIPGPLCSAKVGNPEYSDAPTCLRCRTILQRSHANRRAIGNTEASAKDRVRTLFATVSGPRINPRNRNPHTFYSERKTRASHATFTVGNPLSRRQQYDIVSRRLNAPPNSKLQIRVPSLSSE